MFTEVSGGLSLNEVIENWNSTLRLLAFRLIGSISLFDVLADINSRIKGYKFRGGQQLHHIAPRKVFLNTGIGMVYCSHYVVEAGIDINSPFNTVWLSASFHSALNTNIYYSFVYSATKTVYESKLGVVGVYMVLLTMKIILSIFNYGYVTMNGGII